MWSLGRQHINLAVFKGVLKCFWEWVNTLRKSVLIMPILQAPYYVRYFRTLESISNVFAVFREFLILIIIWDL